MGTTMGNGASFNFSREQIPNLTGKIAIVTGGNTGIGFGICKDLACKGATVVVASRNKELVDKAVIELKKAH